MKILICDDNISVHEMIQRIFVQHTQFKPEFLTASNFTDAVSIASGYPIDLAFLDIQLSQNPEDPNGLDVGKVLVKHNPTAEIVMVTSHQDYALMAFEIHPFAYVTKPIDINMFIEVIKGVLEKIERKTNIPTIQRKRRDTEKLFVCINKEMYWIPYDDILFIEKIGKELVIHTSRTAHTVKWTLSKIEETLPEHFMRVHKSYIVNSQKIRRISEIGDRTYEITFQESNKLALMSRYKANELFELLEIPE